MILMEIFGAIRVEQRPYKLLVKASSGYEIRRYAPVVMIRTAMGSSSSSSNEGSAFQRLAGFIFGRGQAQQTPTPIAMTAPVITTTSKTSDGDGKKDMAFVLPSNQFDSVEKVPEPASKSVRVEAEPEQDLAVLSFTGFATDEIVRDKYGLLSSLLKQDNVSFIDDGTVILNQYNPPWTIPFLRTNEIAIPVISTKISHHDDLNVKLKTNKSLDKYLLVMSEAVDWFKSLPICTKFIFGLSVIIPLGCRLQLLSPYDVILSSRQVIGQLQLWRLVTCFFYSNVDFGYIMLLFFRYRYSMDLEMDWNGRPGDYVFFLSFVAVVLDIFGLVMRIPVFWESFTMAILYQWTLAHANTIVSFLFGMQFKAQYLPWVLIGLDFVTGNDFMGKVLGILVSHLFYFLTVEYPTRFNNNRPILVTPDFMRKMVQIDSGSDSNPTTNPIYSHGRRLDD